MNNIIGEYQKWKQQGDSLRARAKQAMETRFRDLLTEAVHIAQEYQADFGAHLKPPPAVTMFRFKSGAKFKPKKVSKAKAEPPAPPPAPKVEARRDPKLAALEKKLAGARKKLDAAKSAGSSTKNLEDKVYELEDDLRLATQGA
jgi:hypothetical protein